MVHSADNSCRQSAGSPMSCSSFPQTQDQQSDGSNSSPGRPRFHRHRPHGHHHHHAETRAILKEMRHLERTTYKRPLARQFPDPFNGLWRQQIVEWMYTLVKYCNLRQESAAAASYYLDVAVAKGLIRSPNEYQLGAMAALYLALKVYDSPSMRVVKLSSLVKLGNGEFNEQDIIRMERELLLLLKWKIHPSTPNCFLYQYLTLIPGHSDSADALERQKEKDGCRERLEEIASHAIEVALSRDFFLAVPPSVIGYAALLMAIEMDDQRHFLDQTRHQYLHQEPHHAQSPVLTLVDLQSFMVNMAQVASLDNTSPCLVRTSVLLDRTMKSLPIPAEYIKLEMMCYYDTDHYDDDDDHRQNHHEKTCVCLDQECRGLQDVNFLDAAAVACEDGYSPNHVVMQ